MLLYWFSAAHQLWQHRSLGSSMLCPNGRSLGLITLPLGIYGKTLGAIYLAALVGKFDMVSAIRQLYSIRNVLICLSLVINVAK